MVLKGGNFPGEPTREEFDRGKFTGGGFTEGDFPDTRQYVSNMNSFPHGSGIVFSRAMFVRLSTIFADTSWEYLYQT